MFLDFLFDVFRNNETREALVWRGGACSYGELLGEIGECARYLEDEGVARGSVVALSGDFSPRGVAMLLALVERACVVVPFAGEAEASDPELYETARIQAMVGIEGNGDMRCRHTSASADLDLYEQLRMLGHPGLVLFSSGSTGACKAALHDFVALLEKFKTPRPGRRTLAFLKFDHIGGINTLLHALSNAGCVVTVDGRSPDVVCAAIERHRVEVLPVSPTFINMLLMSEAHLRHDLSRLRVVTYGTEVMPESTLARLHECLPHVRLQQTYGLSEVGILRSKSKGDDSLWVKVGGEGFETRVVDGMLEIKARSAMLGYLNAPSPFTEDGWLKTGDAVEVDGEYVRILGRKSEIINVGGEKTYPGEIESVLQMIDGVREAVVSGESHSLTGQVVVAWVSLSTNESLGEFRKRMWDFCAGRLAAHKIPQKVVLAVGEMHNDRFKKMRNRLGATL